MSTEFFSKKKHRAAQPALQAFFLNLLLGILAFAWTMVLHGGLFSVAGDFNVQQIPFAMYANDAIKSGNVVWDWSLDLGSNFIGGMSFYILGNPSFWLSLLFPADAFMYVVGWIYILKYAVAGLTSYLWIRRFVRNPRHAVLASVMYAFSGFMHENLLFYHFHDVVALFPLMLLTFDDLMEKRTHGPFIFAVLINAVVNYFFFFGEVYFLVAYYILRYVMRDGKDAWKRLPEILLEGTLGVVCGMALLLPSVYFTTQNPRVKFDYYGNNSLVFSAERYLYILKALVFPGEVMSDQSAVIEHNFASCAAYIPMAGLTLTCAFLSRHRKHWITRMLKWCLLMAVIPFLNAAFSLFAGLYHRWFYMPVLLFALCGAIMLDELENDEWFFEDPTPAGKAVTRGSLIWGIISAAFILFNVFVPWSSTESGKIFRPEVYGAWSAVSLGGTFFTWLILTRMKKQRTLIFGIVLCVFAAGTGAAVLALYQDANGELAGGLHDRLTTSAQFDDPSPSYRYANQDNPETLTHGFPSTANFCSTVSGSIFRLYESLGLKRDVKSPEAPDGFYELISARYRYETSEQEDAEACIRTVKGSAKTYYIYENADVPPIGFTYDSYITASEFGEINAEIRAAVMLETLVIPDDAEDEVSKVLTHAEIREEGAYTEEEIGKLSRAHLTECSAEAERTTSSYASVIRADGEKYAFFSIPNDMGWSAVVNGEPAEILDICGFMAVRIGEGENRIGFHYSVPGLTAGIALTAAGFMISLLYIIFTKHRRKGAHKS